MKCGRICGAQTCAHSGIEPSTLAKEFSLVRAKGEVFVLLLLFCSFFCQRFLDNPRANSRQILHADVLWFRMCLLPFWGLAAPGGRKKGEMKFLLLWESKGEFLHFGGFGAISQQRLHESTPNIICAGTMSAHVPPPPMVSIGLWGGGGGGVNCGVVSFVHRTATISLFLSDAKCSPICRAQTCAHSGIEPSRSAKAFLQGGPKSSKKFRIFHHFETLRPYISETIKNRGI